MYLNENLIRLKIVLAVGVCCILAISTLILQPSISQLTTPNPTNSSSNVSRHIINPNENPYDCYYNDARYSEGATVEMPGGIKTCHSTAWER